MEKNQEGVVIMSDHNGKDFMLGAAIGGTLGALAALLFTTKQGHKIQREIMGKYHEMDHLVRGYIEPMMPKKKRAKKRSKAR
jgi:gas vesicle protein